MAKKLNTADYLLFGTLAIGGAGYYLYKQGKLPFIDKLFNKQTEKDEKTANTPTDITPVAEKKIVFTPPKDPLKDPIYVSKVKKIQLLVGTGADGDAGKTDGSNTNQALKKKYPTLYASYGRLTPTNIDKYIEGIAKNVASATALQKDKATTIQRKSFGAKLLDLFNKTKAKIVRTNDITEPTKYFDKARKIYVNDGRNVKISKNEPLFPKFSVVGYDTNGFWILTNSSGKFITQNPNEYVAK